MMIIENVMIFICVDMDQTQPIRNTPRLKQMTRDSATWVFSITIHNSIPNERNIGCVR